MKHLFTLLLAALAFVATAQPQKINYQGVAVGANGKPIKNSTVGLRLSVLDSLPTGSTLYTETQAASTDAAGQFSIFLGGGTATVGTFANLPWANGNDKFLKVEMDAQGGFNYQPMGTTQLVSVPYAMAAGTANVIEEGTIMKMKNGHIFRLEYDGTQGGYWKLISGFTPAIITQDTFFVCDTSVWIKGKIKLKVFEDPAWSFWGSSGINGNYRTVDSIQILKGYGDTVLVIYDIFAPGINGNGINADSAYVIFLPNTSSSAGPDQLFLSGTTATLAANTPAAGETGAWRMVAGSGGSLSGSNNPTATFTKGTDSTYTLIWTITGPCGSTSDTVNLRFPAPVGTACGQAVTYAGESYPTVQIGTQCWFAKNLNVGTIISGTSDQTNNSTMEKYCYNNDPANCTTYGGLYQWAEAIQYQNGATNTIPPNPALSGQVKGICPSGWHVPSDNEWCILTTFLDATVNCSHIGQTGTNAGGKMKSTSYLWTSTNIGATNSSSFSALPAGFRNNLNPFYGLGNDTRFWSSTDGLGRDLKSYTGSINRYGYAKEDGFSIRCLKD